MQARQSVRLGFIVLYLAMLWAGHALLFRSPIPYPDQDRSAWFYSGLLALLLGDLLLEPYFTSPKDSVSNSIAALVQIVSFSTGITRGWCFAFIIALFGLVSGVTAMLLGKSTGRR